LKTLIYLHGYNSSPLSHKAQLTTQYMGEHHPSVQCLLPQLSFAPAKAVEQMTALMNKVDNPVIIGSSLGGYYANFLVEQYGCKAVLVNPAVYPDRLLEDYLGAQTNDYTGETYTLTTQHMIELRALATPRMAEPEKRMLMIQTADETLDFSEATHFYQASRSIIEYGGNHSFIGYDQWLPAIADFLALSR
jgi:predicted esterase YcpF (UPF0227 family)